MRGRDIGVLEVCGMGVVRGMPGSKTRVLRRMLGAIGARMVHVPTARVVAAPRPNAALLVTTVLANVANIVL